MDRFWLLTSTLYGNWLPGDPRGFVSSVRDQRPDEPDQPTRHEHDQPGTPCDAALPGLHRVAQRLLKQAPIRINADQASVLARQFCETARFRGWQLVALAILSNHVHWVVGVAGDPDPEKILGDLKAYGSRALSRAWGKPVSGTWWTQKGSTRKLPNNAALLAAVKYVRWQSGALVTYVDPAFDAE